MREDIDAIMSIDLVRKKAFRKRAVARLRWTLVDGTTIAVQVRWQGRSNGNSEGRRQEGKTAELVRRVRDLLVLQMDLLGGACCFQLYASRNIVFA